MKMRQGFVSNSSSSSFLLIGKKLKFSELSIEDVRNKDIRMISYKTWDGPAEGKMTEEYYKILSEYPDKYVNEVFYFFKSEYCSRHEGTVSIDLDIEGSVDILTDTVSMHTDWETQGLENFMDEKLGLDVY